jgi:cytidyltransferase-like protein
MSSVITSGYFIWLHIGHLELFEKASKFGELTVILNNDKQQELKYGRIIVPFNERKKVLEQVKWIDRVVESIDEDRTVCKSIEKYGGDVFAKGGDRFEGEIPEKEICDKLGIKILDGLGDKIQSSSELIKCLENKK